MTLARRTDPRSSHAAGAQLIDSGMHDIQLDVTARAVARLPGLTSRELAERAGLDRYMLARRLPECERLRMPTVRRGAMRRCAVTGRLAMTWWPA